MVRPIHLLLTCALLVAGVLLLPAPAEAAELGIPVELVDSTIETRDGKIGLVPCFDMPSGVYKAAVDGRAAFFVEVELTYTDTNGGEQTALGAYELALVEETRELQDPSVVRLEVFLPLPADPADPASLVPCFDVVL